MEPIYEYVENMPLKISAETKSAACYATPKNKKIVYAFVQTGEFQVSKAIKDALIEEFETKIHAEEAEIVEPEKKEEAVDASHLSPCQKAGFLG